MLLQLHDLTWGIDAPVLCISIAIVLYLLALYLCIYRTSLILRC
jgi:hypothetical protein